MLNINSEKNGDRLDVSLQGRLDSDTSPELEKELSSSIEDVTSMNVDMSGLEYISSAGLRVLLGAKKTLGKKGGVILHNVGEEVKKTLDITGFLDIMDVR